MILDFSPTIDFSFIASFAEALDILSTDNHLIIPAELGEGSIRKVDLSKDLVVVLHHYTLKEDFVLKRKAPAEKNDRLKICGRYRARHC